MKLDSALKKYFQFKELNASYKKEILGGLTTFSSIVYVMIINPTILSDAGMDFGAIMTATILITFLATLLIGILGNYPFAIAPGIGVSAFFTYSIVLKQEIPWQNALTAVFIVSVILFLFTLLNIRSKILTSMPKTLLKAITCGIGLFLIFVGFKQIHVIEASHGAFITLGNPFNIKVVFTLISFVTILFLLSKKISYAFILVILINWILSLCFGLSPWKGILAMPPSLAPTFCKLNFAFLKDFSFYKIFFSLFLVALFDSSAGLYSLLKECGHEHDAVEPKRMRRSLIPDSLSSSLGCLLGTTTLAMHIEAATGIKSGSKTGFTSIVVAIAFLSGLFFYPLLSSIPEFAIAPVLMVLGCHMVSKIKGMQWKDIADVVSFFVTILVMPLTFSIYHGFAYGFISYTLLKILTGKVKKIPITCWIFSILFAAEVILFH